MARLSDISLEDCGQKILLYGPPKSGKTQLAGGLAAHFNTYWFDLEHGYLTLKKFPVEVQRNIELIRIPDNRFNHLAITSMLLMTDGKPVTICDLHGEVGTKCSRCTLSKMAGNTEDIGTPVRLDIERLTKNDLVVIDSLTQLSHSALGKAFGGQTEEKVKPEYSHYMAQGFYLDKVLTNIQQSQANWLVISHEESLQQEEGPEKIVPMAGTRNFSRNTARYFDHVVYLSIKNKKFNRNSVGTNDMKILTGSRTDIDLNDSMAEGLITMLRTVKGTEANLRAVAAVQAMSPAPIAAAPAVETKPLTPGAQALKDKLAATKPK